MAPLPGAVYICPAVLPFESIMISRSVYVGVPAAVAAIGLKSHCPAIPPKKLMIRIPAVRPYPLSLSINVLLSLSAKTLLHVKILPQIKFDVLDVVPDDGIEAVFSGDIPFLDHQGQSILAQLHISLRR